MTRLEEQCVAGVAQLLAARPEVRGVLLPVTALVVSAVWSA